MITWLLTYINIQNKIIIYLMHLLMGKSLTRLAYDEPVNKPYRQLQVDALPIIEVRQKLCYQDLLEQYALEHGKPLKPVKRRKNSRVHIPENLTCPVCDAPHQYLYDNTGGRGQYWCKVCDCHFNQKNHYDKTTIFKCPHCAKPLDKIKSRKDFYIYKCRHDDCPFYQRHLSSMSKADKQRFLECPHEFKVRYIFREFTFDFKPLQSSSPVRSSVDLTRIHASQHVLGLILTYHVNYGLSSRKTAALMQDVHGVSVTHQTVLNYAEAVAKLVKPFVDHYPYELSDSFCGDETYIRVGGRWHYLFFFFDAVKKIILADDVSPNRDTLSAVKAIDQVLLKLRNIPEHLCFIVDGNPIYILAQHFFAQHGIHFDIHQVIGLTNEDPVSTEYRPLKQIIERLNRTFKGYYRFTNGFGSGDGAVAHVTLFVAYFNFLRPHAKLEQKVPVMIPDLIQLPHMPARWTKLIELAQHFIMQQQTQQA